MSDIDAKAALDWLMRVHDSDPSQQRLTIVLDRLEAAEAAVARVRELADAWTTATCQTDGAPCSWHRVAADCADELRAALDGDER